MVSQSTVVRSRRTSSKFCGGAIASQLRERCWMVQVPQKCRMRTSQTPRTGVSKPKTVGRQLNRNVVRAVSIFFNCVNVGAVPRIPPPFLSRKVGRARGFSTSSLHFPCSNPSLLKPLGNKREFQKLSPSRNNTVH